MNKLIYAFGLIFLGILPLLSAQTLQINGYVLEEGSAEPLPYSSIRVKGSSNGGLTNSYGYFSFAIKDYTNTHSPPILIIEATGFKTEEFQVSLPIKEPLRILLQRQESDLDSVYIQAQKIDNNPGVSSLGTEFIESIPTFLGERDVIKALQYLPGVQRANDGNSSLHVRGGNGDQNLILLDEAPVYNVNHLFGFFSIFNGDAVQNIEFIKGGFPAHYGERLSSVVAVTTREGSREKWGFKGGVGISSANMTAGGPVLNKRGSLLLSVRRTYWDAVIRPFIELSQPDTKPFFFFHDYNAKLSLDLSPKDKLIASVYNSRDRYGETEFIGDIRLKTGFTWQNLTANVRWNRILSPKAFINSSIAE